jgi:predicted ATPase
MRYKSFRIRGYKGIKKNMIIDLEKGSLIPLIGINECGKTTVLEAIFSFDRFNDPINGGRHLENVDNMYSTLKSEAKVEAETEFIYEELVERLDEIEENFKQELKGKITEEKRLAITQKLDSLPSYRETFQRLASSFKSDTVELSLGRDLKTKRYYFIDLKDFDNEALNHDLIFEFMRLLPYILYFDDFRDRLDERLEIPSDEESPSDWVAIVNLLFQSTNDEYSIFDLPNKNENIRRSILAEVEAKLNEELLKEWPNFSIQQSQPLEIKIVYSSNAQKHFLEFLIVEKILIEGRERERYFKIQDRSKGFFWYFNFIMKLIFNTKTRDTFMTETIYLLDEPGSYLHSTAQFRLTRRLKDISKKNIILYCTHSPYLLDPTIIPINTIKIVEKDSEGSIELKSAFESKVRVNKKNSAFQPIYDALDVRPLLLDYDLDNIVLVEGIYDYLSFEMFKKDGVLNFFPCVNADSILNNISYMIFLRKNYLALWDNDKEGLEQKKKAEKYFGEVEAKKFIVLPAIGNGRKSRLENFYKPEELQAYKSSFSLPKNQSFEKIILHLFYSEKRASNIAKFFPITQGNFGSAISKLEPILKGR